MKAQAGWMWLLVTFALICLWYSQCSLALPVGKKEDFANPSQEQIDQVTEEHAKKWMLKYKVAKKGQTVNLTTELSKIQRRAGINVTGKLDDATKRLFIIPRCGVAESDDEKQEYGGIINRRKKRYNLQGTSWQKKDLTYRFISTTDDLPVDVQQNILRKMLKKWQDVSTLTMREETDPSVSDDDVEILISFVRLYHGDPYEFDGQGGTLAHAYYPHSNRGLSGDAHFDDDERFTTGTSDGINLDWVAVHEFGHSLGLEHSSVRESIMYPWYKGYFENIELTDDDISGIQDIYGKPTPTPTTAQTTTETPTTQPETTTKSSTTETPTTRPVTTTKITTTEAPTTKPESTTTETPTTKPDTTTKSRTTEAPTTQADTTTKISTTEAPTTQADTTTKISTSETPTTKPDTTTKISTTETPTTKPDTTTKSTTAESTTKATTQTSTESPTTPHPVVDVCKVEKFDSFVMGMDGKTYVFSGEYFWVLSDRLDLESGPTLITSKWKELRTPINSAYTNWDGRTVFFKGSEYWMYFDDRLEEGPMHINQYGLPSSLGNMDAAFIWEKNYKTYFFKGENYWRFNELGDRNSMDSGYPKHISIWGLPHSMQSAMSWSGNKRTYFFKDDKYWKLDDRKLKLVSGYPRDITKIWMKCAT